MSPNELIELKKGIVMTAAYYNRQYPDDVIAMMASDLEDLPFNEVADSFKKYRLDPKNKTFPLPAQIREMVTPIPNKDAEARELLSRIKTAISKFGWTQGEAARQYLGDIAWQLVSEQGGWSNLCSSDFLQNDSMQAQARNRLIDLVTYGPRLKLVVDNKIHLSNEEKNKIESRRQIEEFESHQKQITPSKPDTNAEYLLKSPEDRQKIIQDFIKNYSPKGSP